MSSTIVTALVEGTKSHSSNLDYMLLRGAELLEIINGDVSLNN